jgi:hypothetical protein
MQSQRYFIQESIKRMEYPQTITNGKVVKDHPYIGYDAHDEKYGTLYRCRLCGVGRLTVEKVRQHCDRSDHAIKAYDLREDVRRALLVAERVSNFLANPLHDRIQALTGQIPATAIDAAHAEFYRYLIAPAANGRWGEDDLRDRPLKKLKACFQNEVLLLLALAVWKAQCLQQMPPDDTAAQDWIQSRWKSYKAQESRSNAAEIIVTSVRPFLDWSKYI